MNARRHPVSALTAALILAGPCIPAVLLWQVNGRQQAVIDDVQDQLDEANERYNTLSDQLTAQQGLASCRTKIASTTDGRIIDFLLATADPVKYPYTDAVTALEEAGSIRQDTAVRCGS